MPSDAGPDWVCPRWSYEETGYGSLVFVLNLGPANANVRVTFHDSTSAVLFDETRAVPSRNSALFAPGLGDGWLEVHADQPVVPWGYVPVLYGGALPPHLVHMSFYQFSPPRRKTSTRKPSVRKSTGKSSARKSSARKSATRGAKGS
jgi:hypothetical protein